MPDNRDLYQRRTFWPRSERPELLGEVDFDRPCPNCDYNLRGLAAGAACPECGSREGLNLGAAPIPWDVRQTWLTFLRTTCLVIVHPHEFARQLWSTNRLDLSAARRYRRIRLTIATPILCAVAWALTAAAVGTTRAWWCVPMDLAAVIVWLNAATIEPVTFFRDKASGRLLKRVEVLAHYACAPLALAPLHFALLPYTWRLARVPDGFLIAAALHVGLLLACMGLGVIYLAWLTHETIDLSRPAAFAVAFAAATVHVATAAVLLVGVPVFAAGVASRLAG